MKIYQRFDAAYKRVNATRAAHESIQHMHYCALQHLRDSIRSGIDIEEALQHADRLEQKVSAAYAEYRQAADALAQISQEMKVAA